MWAKDGGRYLPSVLKRIEEVIPAESVANRIFVDNASTDNTRQIAKDFNWTIYVTPVFTGIAEAARHASSPILVALEQDVLLARGWWERIPPHIEDRSVGAAQGVRFATDPVLRAIEPPPDTKEGRRRLWKQFREGNADYFWSTDNTIFKTSILKAVLGKLPLHYTDFRELYNTTAHYRWIVDPRVVSEHIRLERDQYVRKLLYTMTVSYGSREIKHYNFQEMLLRFATSPIRALQLTAEKRNPLFMYYYPYVRLMMFRAIAMRRRSQASRFYEESS